MRIDFTISLLKTISSISCGIAMADLHVILAFIISPGIQFYDGMEKRDLGFSRSEIPMMVS